MQKNVLIALAIIGTIATGFVLFRQTPKKPVDTNTTALKELYNQWKLTYKINVGAAENDYRFKVFSSNYEVIQKGNQKNRTFTLGLNAFAHLTREEFAAIKLGFKAVKSTKNVSALPKAAATAVDWTPKLNAVKDQGQCGSCWAFSAVGAIEGAWSVLNGQLFDLAEQELVDCGSETGNEGCNGGLMDYAFQYAINHKGLSAEDAYPYTATDGTCNQALTHQAPVTGYTDVTVNNADALVAAITQQPVSVAIEADQSDFQYYTSGVITGTGCGTQLDHGVLAVGFDTTAETPYFKVRNSWGASWGEAGYVRIGIKSDDAEGVCGILQAASYPTL